MSGFSFGAPSPVTTSTSSSPSRNPFSVETSNFRGRSGEDSGLFPPPPPPSSSFNPGGFTSLEPHPPSWTNLTPSFSFGAPSQGPRSPSSSASPSSSSTSAPTPFSFSLHSPFSNPPPLSSFSSSSSSSSSSSTASTAPSSTPTSVWTLFRSPTTNPFSRGLTPNTASTSNTTTTTTTSGASDSTGTGTEGLQPHFVFGNSCPRDEEPVVPSSELDEQSNLFCVIHHDVMRNPVRNSRCKHTYCRNCITRWMESKAQSEALNSSNPFRRHGDSKSRPDCPICRASIEQLEVDRDVEDKLKQITIHCKYGVRFDQSKQEWVAGNPEEGYCPEVVQQSRRNEHEKTCDYAIVTCPFGGGPQCVSANGTPIRRRTVEAHRYECPFALVAASSDQIKLNVGGTVFSTTKSTLRKDPNSRLASLVAPGRSPSNLPLAGTDGTYFIDRDPGLFGMILNYLRNDCNPTEFSHLDQHQLDRLLLEVKFYGLSATLRSHLEELSKKKKEDAETQQHPGMFQSTKTEFRPPPRRRHQSHKPKFIALRASSQGTGAERMELGLTGWSEPRFFPHVHLAIASVASDGYEPYPGPVDWLEATFSNLTYSKPNERTLYFKLDPSFHHNQQSLEDEE